MTKPTKINADDLAIYQKDGWTAKTDKDGNWYLSKEHEGKEYSLRPCPMDNYYDPPRIFQRWMFAFADPLQDEGDNAVGILHLNKAKMVAEWRMGNADATEHDVWDDVEDAK